jgi:hypothetical protein
MTPSRHIFLLSLMAFVTIVAGCQKPSDDTSTVRPPVEDDKSVTDCSAMLPLKPGFSWTFATKVDQRTFTDVASVRGPLNIGGTTATLVETKRNGQLVLREGYRYAKGKLMLTAFSTSTKQWVVLDPPLVLLKDGAMLGDEYKWNGLLRIDGKSIDAHGLARPSLRESVQTVSAGRFSGIRIDSGLSAPLPNGDHIKYQTTRWVATGIGFIRREYLDRTARRQSNLISFKMK